MKFVFLRAHGSLKREISCDEIAVFISQQREHCRVTGRDMP